MLLKYQSQPYSSTGALSLEQIESVLLPSVPNDLSREKDKEQEIDIKEKDRWRCLLAAVAAMQSLTACEDLKLVTYTLYACAI